MKEAWKNRILLTDITEFRWWNFLGSE